MTHSTRRSLQSRRDLLGMAGPAALLLAPLLRTRQARAAAPIPPKFLAMFFPNGPSCDVEELFYPQRKGARWDWKGKFTEPLAEFSPYATVVRHIALNRGEHNFTQGYHGAGIVTWLTASDELNYADGTDHHSSQTHSIDQHIALLTGTRAIYTAVGRGRHRVASVSYLGNNRPNIPEQDPERAYLAVFDGGFHRSCDAESLQRARLAARRDLLVLDTINKDLVSARRTFGLGREEREKLESFEEHLASIERRLRRQDAVSACEPRDIPKMSFDGKHTIPGSVRLHCDVIAAALAFTDARAGVLQLFHDSNDQDHSGWLPVPNKGHHKIQHEGPDAPKHSRLITTWFAEQLAYLLRTMRGLRVEDDSLLDRSIVLWGTDNPKGIGNTAAHGFKFDYGQLIFGRGGLRGGQDIDRGRRINHVDILGTICRAMGVDTKHYQQRKGWGGFIDEMLA